jgi:arylamine N-acetyltransferase
MCDRTYGPNTHCCAVLEHGGEKFLLDPGFLSFAPIRIAGEPVSLETVYNTITLAPADDRKYQLHTCYRSDRKYRFTLRDEPVPEETFIEHWRKSFYLESLSYPVVTMLKGDAHLYLQKENLFVRTREGSEQIRVPAAKMPETLEKYFGIKAAVSRKAMKIFL